MDADEREIVQYLETWGENFVHGKEIARRASSKKRFTQDPNWAKPVLARLKDARAVENDHNGRYRLAPGAHGEEAEWVAPDIEKLLQEDIPMSENYTPDAAEEESEPL